MNAVRTWLLAICFAVLAVAVLQYLAPPGSMEKMIRYVTGAFLVCAMAFSLKSVLPKIPLAFSIPTQYGAESEFSSFVESQEITAAQESVERLAETEINKMGISCKNIHADMDKQEDGSIGINRIEITLASGYEGYGARVESYLSETLGVPVEVMAGENG